MSKHLYLFIILGITKAAFAITCPTPQEIGHDQFNGFKAFSNVNGEPILGERLAQFKRNVSGFYSTRWLAGAFEGAAHCYYFNKFGKWTYAFLSRHGLEPDFTSKAWVVVHDEPKCDESLSACQFKLSA